MRRVEIPKDFVALKAILKKSLPVALGKVHPTVRQMNVNVFFVDRIIDKEGVKQEVHSSGGKATWKVSKDRKQLNILISLSSNNIVNNPKQLRSVSAAQILFHEFFETDYWFKSFGLKEVPEHKSLNAENYNSEDHEVIPDHKTAVLLQDAGVLTTKIRDRQIHNNIFPEFFDN